jgi:hypothetical protein
MWNFLSIRPDFLGAYVFFLYDDKRAGRLRPDQIQEMIEAVHSGKFDNNPQIKKLVAKLVGKKGSPPLTIEAFTDWARINPALIQPFISIQHKLRSEVVGIRFWEGMTEKRQMTVDFGHPRYCVNLYKRILTQEKGCPPDADEGFDCSHPVSSKAPQTMAASRKILSKSNSQVVPDSSPPVTFSQLDAFVDDAGGSNGQTQGLSYGYTAADNVADNIKESAQEYTDQQEWYGDERDGSYYDYQSEQWVPYPDAAAQSEPSRDGGGGASGSGGKAKLNSQNSREIQRTVSAVPSAEKGAGGGGGGISKPAPLPPLQVHKKPAPSGEGATKKKKKKKTK